MKDLEATAKELARAGFTLKRPHVYADDFQKGLTAQSIKLKNGQYFQIVSPRAKNLGALARWYEELIKDGPVGATLILEDMPLSLKDLDVLFKENSIEAQYQKFDRYEWLSFKTQSPYAPLSFIAQSYLPADSDELLAHDNQAVGLGKIELRPVGNPEVWAKIMTLSQSTDAQLSFDAPMFGGKGFIPSVEIKTTKKPLPAPLKIGHILLKFIN